MTFENDVLSQIHALTKRVEHLETMARAVQPSPPVHRTANANSKTFSEFEGGGQIPRVAPESELYGKFGDPTVKFDPKRWQGDSYVGAAYSQCPPDYLREVESFELWKAERAHETKTMSSQGKPIWLMCLRSASKAAGWAKVKESAELLHRGEAKVLVPVPRDELPF